MPFLEIISRLHDFPDDGHAIKLGRASLICHDICKRYENREWVRIEGDDLWTKIYHLTVDSVEAPGPNWVRSCGFEEAWKACCFILIGALNSANAWCIGCA